MARRYGTFTPARRAALRKAQLASAAKRRGRRRRTVVRRVAKGIGVAGAVAGAGYGVHRSLGNQAYRSKHPTHYGPAPTTLKLHFDTHGFRTGASIVQTAPHGKPVGKTGFSVNNLGDRTVVHHTRRTRKGVDKTLSYVAMHPGTKKVLGTKIGPAPHRITEYKPTRADVKNMRKHNRPIPGTDQYAREAMTITHSTGSSYTNRKIEAGEALRRTRAYVQAQESMGNKISAAHHIAASKFFASQPRYTAGTVKPLRRKKTAGKRRRQARFYGKRNNSVIDPKVLGSKKRTK